MAEGKGGGGSATKRTASVVAAQGKGKPFQDDGGVIK
jgi:hypothetical protein